MADPDSLTLADRAAFEKLPPHSRRRVLDAMREGAAGSSGRSSWSSFLFTLASTYSLYLASYRTLWPADGPVPDRYVQLVSVQKRMLDILAGEGDPPQPEEMQMLAVWSAVHANQASLDQHADGLLRHSRVANVLHPELPKPDCKRRRGAVRSRSSWNNRVTKDLPPAFSKLPLESDDRDAGVPPGSVQTPLHPGRHRVGRTGSSRRSSGRD
ncbi:hypothetical protein NpPPO83_00010958 [Neofusicoccum parvum]|uniref:Uncharacterized protein n=1 Tax=Neofusicoccum parvum TaxID=310453 RepID=A0ACB5SDM2_9PEZI|nr:hypothetical protein NpPPO83_00010958 [Neofusicoccum parvum]